MIRIQARLVSEGSCIIQPTGAGVFGIFACEEIEQGLTLCPLLVWR